jgi:hypothetical protein
MEKRSGGGPEMDGGQGFAPKLTFARPPEPSPELLYSS